METDEDQRVIPFKLQFDKPVASQVFLLLSFPFYLSDFAFNN